MGKIKVNIFWNNKIVYGNIRTGIVRIDWFLSIAINPKNNWTSWVTSSVTFSCYIWCRAQGWNFRYDRVILWDDTFGTAVYGGCDDRRQLIL